MVVIHKYQKNHVPDSQKSLKFLVSGDMTVSQLVYIFRRRMKLSLDHGFNLLFNKGRTLVMMSQRLGEISSKYKDPKGILRFIYAAQNTFGCRVPRIKPIKSIFPGIEPTPFGAPEPSLWFEDTIFGAQDSEEAMMLQLDDVESTFMQYVLAHSSPPDILQQMGPVLGPAPGASNSLPVIPTVVEAMMLQLDDVESTFMQYVLAHSSPPDILQQMGPILGPAPGASNSLPVIPTVVYAYVPGLVSPYSLPMEVSEPSNIFQQPLSTLQHSLGKFVPFSPTQSIPQLMLPATVLYSWAHAPLVTSLYELVMALEKHLSVASYEPNQTATQSNATPPYTPPNLSANFIPFDLDMLPNSVPVEHVTGPLSSDAILHTLDLANMTMDSVLCDLNSPSSLLPSSAAIFSALVPYFEHMARHVYLNSVITHLPSMLQHHSSPMPSPSPSSSVNAGQHNFTDVLPVPSSHDGYSMASYSSEEDAAECFCDILL